MIWPSESRLLRPRTADDIRALARQLGTSLARVLALSVKQDPFYAPGTPTGQVHAQWFVDLWHSCGYAQLWDVHLRRMHYKLVSAFPDLLTADTRGVDPKRGIPGKPYENRESSFEYLIHASQLARAGGLVDPARLVDHRNPQVHGGEYGAAAAARSFVWDDAGSWHLRGLPTMLGLFLDFALPTLRAEGYDYSASMQPYLLEIWIEKSTMDTVLGRLAASHGVRVVTSVGFQSITNAVKFLQRVARAGKGARVLYVSDCDPAGRHMPSSVARQLEFWFQRYAQGADIKLDPVALTREQVQHYHLPRIPIKDSDMRKERFEEVYGEGAVELDALEALYPGELLRLLRSRLDPYVDNTLQDRLADAEAEVNAQARALWREATADLRTEAKALEADARGVYGRYERVLARLSARLERDLEPIRERLGGLQARIAEAQEAFEPPALDAPAPDVDPQGEEDWLYSSDRDYLTQNRYYQARKQGRTVAELDAEAETKRRQEAEDWATMTGPFPGGCPPYNPIRHKLGRLCKRGHAWGSTGQTLRVNNKDTPVCLYCHAEHNYIRRRSRGPDDPLPQWDYDPTRNYLAPAGVAEAQDDEDGAEDEYDAEPTD